MIEQVIAHFKNWYHRARRLPAPAQMIIWDDYLTSRRPALLPRRPE